MPDENYVQLVGSYFRPADTFEVKYLRQRLENVYRKLLPDTERRHQIRPYFLGEVLNKIVAPPFLFHFTSREDTAQCVTCITMTSLFHRPWKIRLKHHFLLHRTQTTSSRLQRQ